MEWTTIKFIKINDNSFTKPGISNTATVLGINYSDRILKMKTNL